MATHRKQLDEYCSEVRSDWCCRHKVMYGNSKNVIAMSQSAILLSLGLERELPRTLNPAVCGGHGLFVVVLRTLKTRLPLFASLRLDLGCVTILIRPLESEVLHFEAWQ